MGLLISIIAAFGIGAAAVWGMGAYGMYMGKEAVRQAANAPRPQVKAWKTPDTTNLLKGLHPKLDPNIGKNIPPGHFNRQINQAIHAGKMVPLPPRPIPGVRR